MDEKDSPSPIRSEPPAAPRTPASPGAPPRARSRLTDRIVAVIHRDPLTAPNALRNDAIIAAVLALVSVAVTFAAGEGRRPDPLGYLLLVGSVVPLVWRRRQPLAVALTVVAVVCPYHALGYNHAAPIAGTLLALYTVGATQPMWRTLLLGVGVTTLAVTVMLNVSTHEAMEALRTSGWIIAVLFVGTDVRIYRRYIGSIVERAERAERTREEEAARRVAEERLRIARDLHDLLAHSITLIGVQTSVAAHVLNVDPDRLDRAAISKALDDISDTCRTARGELRTTLDVLRAGEHGDGRGPLPGLDGLTDLAAAARTAGADVGMTIRAEPPPAVGAAVYRIVQEALTNAVRHAGPVVGIEVTVREEDGVLRVAVTDDGAAAEPSGTEGYGLVGMRERARSVGGTLTAGPRPGGGFAVVARLPLQDGAPVDDGVREPDAVRVADGVRVPDGVREGSM